MRTNFLRVDCCNKEFIVKVDKTSRKKISQCNIADSATIRHIAQNCLLKTLGGAIEPTSVDEVFPNQIDTEIEHRSSTWQVYFQC